MRRDVLIDAAAVCIAAAAAVFFATRLIHEGYVTTFADASWAISPAAFLEKHLFVWNSYLAPSGGVSFRLSQLPAVLLDRGFAAAFGASAGQMASLGLAIGVGWAATYGALRALAFSRTASIVAVVVYALTPWFYQALPGGVGLAWVYAWSPVVVASFASAARFPATRTAMRLALVLIAALPASVSGGRLSEAIALVAFVALSVLLARPEDPAPFRRWTRATLLWMVAGALWWIVPSLLPPLLERSVEEAVPQRNIGPFLLSLGIAGAALGLCACALSRGDRVARVRFAVVAGFVSIALAAVPALDVLSWALPIVAVWSFAYGAAAVVEAGEKRRPALGVVVAVAATAAIVVSAFDLRDGVFREGTLSEPSSYVAVPQYWYDAATWLGENQRDGGILVLPSESGAAYEDYSWGRVPQDGVAADLLPSTPIVVNAPGSAFDPASEGTILNLLAGNVRADLSVPLHRLGIRYVLVRNDLRTSALPALDLEGRLAGARVIRFGPLTIFDTGAAGAPLAIGRAWIAGDYVGVALPQIANLFLDDVPRLDVRDLNRPAVLPSLAYEVSASVRNQPFAGGDAARASVAGAPLRLLWQSPMWWAPSREFSFVFEKGALLQGVAQTVASPVDRASLTLPAPLLRRPANEDELPMLATSFESAVANHIYWVGVNPSNRTVAADVRVAVRPLQATSYAIAANGAARSDALAASPVMVWAELGTVVFPPGLSSLTIDAAPAVSGRVGSAAGATAPHQLQVRPLAYSSPGPGTPYYASLKSIPLHVALQTAPTIEFFGNESSVPAQRYLSENVEVEGRRYRCPLQIGRHAAVDLKGTFEICASLAGVTEEAVRSATLESVGFDAIVNAGGAIPTVPDTLWAVLTWGRGSAATARLPMTLASNDTGISSRRRQDGSFVATLDPGDRSGEPTIRLSVDSSKTPGEAPIEITVDGASAPAAWLYGDSSPTPIADVLPGFKLAKTLSLRTGDVPHANGDGFALLMKLQRAKTRRFVLNYRASTASVPMTEIVTRSGAYGLSNGSQVNVASPGAGNGVQVIDTTDRTLIGAVGPAVSTPVELPQGGRGLPVLAMFSAADAFVRLKQAYSPAWLAGCLGTCSPLPAHLREVAGWNLWPIDGSGIVIIVNWAVLLQILVAALALVAVVVNVWATMRRAPVA